MAHDLRGRDDLAVFAVVGNVQQPAHHNFVAGYSFGLKFVGFRRGAFDDKAAFGPHRHDDAVLDHLRFHQTQNLGAEIVTPVRPADASAGDFAAAQMHGFGYGAVDKNFDQGFGQRHKIDGATIEFDRKIGFGRSFGIGLEIVCAERRLHQIQVAAHDTVFFQNINFGEGFRQVFFCDAHFCGAVAFQHRIMARVKQGVELLGCLRMRQ